MPLLIKIIGIIVFPFSIVYGIITWIRNKLYDFKIIKSYSFPTPIISVGNITVGGTGKTPHVEYLIHLLKDYKVAVLSRGYKRKTEGFRIVELASKVSEVGDEPLQIKLKNPSVTVAVDEKRVHGAAELLNSKNKPDIILLDDAYQHRSIVPGFSILLVDYNRPIFSDFTLPSGRLREFACGSKRADIIIVTKTPTSVDTLEKETFINQLNLKYYQKAIFSHIKYMNHVIGVFDDSMSIEKDDLIQNKTFILTITGIANPTPFYNYLDNSGLNFRKKEFLDHYNFTKQDYITILSDFNAIDTKSKIIICTEKDAVRIREDVNYPVELKKTTFYWPIKIYFNPSDEKILVKTLELFLGNSIN